MVSVCVSIVTAALFFSAQGSGQCMCLSSNRCSIFSPQGSGQCKCKPGYGGPRCCECENGYWGTPLNNCTRKLRTVDSKLKGKLQGTHTPFIDLTVSLLNFRCDLIAEAVTSFP